MATTQKTAARKTTARKASPARKATARTLKPRKLHPMTAEIRELGASVLALATEQAMASESLGVTGTSTKELPGKRQGMMTLVKLDDGTRITFTLVVR